MQKRNLTKEKIIQTAFSLADEIGLHQITFPKLADKLGIKYPSLYNHFKNMEDLKLGMTVYLMNDLNSSLMKRLVGKSGEAAVREFAEIYRQFAFENKTAYGLYMNLPSLENPEVHGLAKETFVMIYQVLNYYIKDKTELIHKGRAFRSLLHGFVSLYSFGYFHGEADVEESFQSMIDDFIFSLSAK